MAESSVRFVYTALVVGLACAACHHRPAPFTGAGKVPDPSAQQPVQPNNQQASPGVKEASSLTVDLMKASCDQLNSVLPKVELNTNVHVPEDCDLKLDLVNLSAVMTLSPGSHLHASSLALSGHGALHADGTAEKPVTLTMTGNSCEPIDLPQGSTLALVHTLVEQATSAPSCDVDKLFGINSFISGSGNLSLSDTILRGLPSPAFQRRSDGTQTFHNVSFVQMPYAFAVSLGELAALPTDFTFDRTDYIALTGDWGNKTDIKINAMPIPFVVTKAISLAEKSDNTLTIAPGVHIDFTKSGGIDTGYSNYKAQLKIGEAIPAAQVVLSSKVKNPALADYWSGLHLKSNTTLFSMSNTSIGYATTSTSPSTQCDFIDSGCIDLRIDRNDFSPQSFTINQSIFTACSMAAVNLSLGYDMNASTTDKNSLVAAGNKVQSRGPYSQVTMKSYSTIIYSDLPKTWSAAAFTFENPTCPQN